MKNMLHISLALMLIAGSAGAIDFVRMFRTGEIDKIYSHDEPVKKKSVAHTAAVITPAALVEKISARVEEIVIDPDDYGRSALMQEEVINEELTEAPVAVIAEAPIEAPAPAEAKVVLATADIKDKPIATEGKKRTRFKASMFSRAYIPEEEDITVEVIDIAEPVAAPTAEVMDTTEAKVWEY